MVGKLLKRPFYERRLKQGGKQLSFKALSIRLHEMGVSTMPTKRKAGGLPINTGRLLIWLKDLDRSA